MTPFEIEVVERILEYGEVLTHTATIEEELLEDFYIENIKVLYEGVVYEIVKLDGLTVRLYIY